MRRADRNTYSSDKNVSRNSAIIQIEFALNNLDALRSKDKDHSKERALFSFAIMLRNDETFTGGQLKYIDGIYETVMKGYNLPSVGMHIDKKRRGIRY